MFNEDKIIQQLKASSHRFIGDDAAILPQINNSQYVIAKDLLVEGVHFRARYFGPQDLAHKALHVNLSDLAAMGAKPLYILCGISVPSRLQTYASDFLKSLIVSCQEAGVVLIGGDTTSSKSDLFISITAIGQASKDQIKHRSTAKNDDLICVAGNLGWAHLGFAALEHGDADNTKYINSLLRPEANIKEGAWLGKQIAITSMMDISDGLYIDLKRLCEASNKKAYVDIDLLQSILEPEISVQTALEGGEDYGLLFTANKESFEKLSNEFTKSFGYQLKVIGHIGDGNGVTFKQGNQEIKIPITPFTHFGEKS